MADILDYFGLDPALLAYRYRSSSGETLPRQPELYRFQDGQVQPYQAPTGDLYDPLREQFGVTDLQRGFQNAQEGNYPAAAGNIALGTGTMAAALPFGAFGMMARGARKGADALSALDAAITKTRSAKELAANAAEPQFAQYATQYPPTLPPTVKLKEKQKVEGGTETYLSRQMSPEGQALMDERARIQKDLDTYGYQPYYDPAKRSYVDPSNYPPAPVDVASLGGKMKWDTISDYMTKVGAPETLAALRAAYDKGLTLGDTQHWYALAQLERDFIKELGPEAGRAAFLDKFAVPMGPTTSGNAPRENLMMAQYLEHLRATGQPYPTHGSQMPAPMYGEYLTTNLRDYMKMRAGEQPGAPAGTPSGYDAIGETQPKMLTYIRSFLGDLSRGVMDKQMTTGMLAHAKNYVDKVRTRGYGLIHAPLASEAERMGIEPGNLQDVAWAGFGNKTGKPFIMEINDAIERTHRLTGMDRAEIVRRALIRKEIPLYGGAGIAATGGLGGLGGTE